MSSRSSSVPASSLRLVKRSLIPVVSAEDHLKLVGVIPEGNIFKAYSDGIGEIRQEEYGDS